KSSVLAKLKAGNRDIEASYIAHSRYKGKQLSQLKRRRQEELAVLFVKDPADLLKDESSSSNTGPEDMEEEVTEITNLSYSDKSEENNDSIKILSQNLN
ncbi:MAG: hypothetical protein K2H49_04795, partial [Muribaculaceae bacterium]|nr:hypothetical protein [Muribaculaceae bacterium]